ncbi:hypothetical protein SAMD00023353_9500250 [Rosellinia necatrix]|uniref:Uncharacterized protein n=1 Tax=Rosellinia necatrix TaxID=77044 RepID=A0A1S8AB33_ROSNE|nr:hypothetical protein SAMD00023353_9500250 [Rosellinia necatrix]
MGLWFDPGSRLVPFLERSYEEANDEIEPSSVVARSKGGPLSHVKLLGPRELPSPQTTSSRRERVAAEGSGLSAAGPAEDEPRPGRDTITSYVVVRIPSCILAGSAEID